MMSGARHDRSQEMPRAIDLSIQGLGKRKTDVVVLEL